MNCPKCNKEMKIMKIIDIMMMQDGENVEVIGRCDDCDFDAIWEIFTDLSGETQEYNFERYFFG